LPSFIAIKFAENHLYRIGLSLFASGSQTRSRFHNPFFVSLIICAQIFKSITAILMKEDKHRLLLIGDFTHFLNGRYLMNSCVILWGILALLSQILHYWKYFKNESPSYLKPFEMIRGSVSPKSIRLTNRDQINQLLNKSKLMFKVSNFLVYTLSFAKFGLSFIVLIINSSLLLYSIEIIWALLFAAFIYFSVNINFSQMTYFYIIILYYYYIILYIICLYLNLKLTNANNSIRKCFNKKYRMTNSKMKNILESLNSIAREINTYNNDFWSKYLIIFLILILFVLDLVLFESIFGKMYSSE
jgi:hypothetical protein